MSRSNQVWQKKSGIRLSPDSRGSSFSLSDLAIKPGWTWLGKILKFSSLLGEGLIQL